MGYQATLSKGIYHRGGEFDGNIDFELAIEPEVPMEAALDNLRVIRADESQPCEILGYSENADGFAFTVYAENFPYEDSPTVQLCWFDQDLGTLDLTLQESENGGGAEASAQSGCGTAIVLLSAGLFGLLAKLGLYCV
jgi:hypothetical protein